MKRVLSLLWGLAAAGEAVAGIAPPYGWTSEPMTLDIESGMRTAAGTESLCLDAAWVAETTNGVTFKMSVNGAEKARVGAYGAWNWSEARPGAYAVTAQAYRNGALVGETLTATFAVAGHDLVNADVAVDAANVIYDGTAKCPSVVVRLGGVMLTEGEDYVLSYEDNVAAGVAKVVIAGKDKYVDEIERSFTIRPACCCCALDVQSGVREAASVESLAYDMNWDGATTAKIAVNGAELATVSGVGATLWQPTALFCARRPRPSGERGAEGEVKAVAAKTSRLCDRMAWWQGRA